MKKRILTLAAAAAIVSTATLLPTRADAMSVGTAAAIEAAVAELGAIENVAYVCRWRYNRRVCWWVPSRRVYRPYRSYRSHRFHRRRW